MSLQFNSLVLETTDRCNARCAMCYQAAGPRGSDIRGDWHLPLDVTLRVIEEAATMPEVADRVHVSGGEGFLNYDEMVAIFLGAKRSGFSNIGATTNGFWAVTESLAARRCYELAEAGVTYFEVSIDHWHLPYVPLQRVRQLLTASRRAGIAVMLRTLTSRSHHMAELLAEFTDAELLHAKVANSLVHPVGRGAVEVPREEYYIDGKVEGCCRDILNLTIAPNGNVYPCCAGADMTESLAMGNVLRDSLPDAVFKMRTERLIREIVHNGSGSLIPLIEKLGFGDRLSAPHSGICHLCWDIFRDNELSAALRSHFQGLEIADLTAALQALLADEVGVSVAES